ncbi:rCop c3 [Coprinopsis cinerea AmutBmut pab1-1]|nr:rCop c3 [Coprinopsis cinerea AmutBmut pab1-1]
MSTPPSGHRSAATAVAIDAASPVEDKTMGAAVDGAGRDDATAFSSNSHHASETALSTPAAPATPPFAKEARTGGGRGQQADRDRAPPDPANLSGDSSNSGLSEAVEIYLNDLGFDDSTVGHNDEPPVDESPLLPAGPRVSNHVHSSPQSALISTPLPTPSQPAGHSTTIEAKGTAQRITSTGPSTPTVSITASEPASGNSTKLNLSAPRTSTPRDLLSPVTDLDSPRVPPATRMTTVPLPEFDDDPTLSLPTSMEQLDLGSGQAPSRPPSHESQVGKSSQEKQRMRPLSMLMPGGAGSHATPLATPPPTSPLPGLPGSPSAGNPPSTAPPHMASFPSSRPASDHSASPTNTYHTVSDTNSPSSANGSVNSRSSSIPGTPNFSMQPSSSYTQSQPLPQLPTFAPALAAISERSMSKDDLDASLDAERRVIKKEASSSPNQLSAGRDGKAYDDGFASNRGDRPFDATDNQSSQQHFQAPPSQHLPGPPQQTIPQQHHHLGMPGAGTNVTLTPNHQQYGTITVSNSVVSFPSSTTPPTSVTSPLARDDSFASSQGQPVPSGMVGPADHGACPNKTPNVYINGLPPHFPEDQLYALAAPFGEVKSVRTFTRHVRDSESGYGFVLFETIEAAERCIASLRRYRNLHPTFSKQVHKIPGTVYAQVKQATPSDSSSSNRGWDGSEDEDASFKARMEALADPLSTNLYMEGLPLSIDEPTLGALVAPHRIVSSRFFQTRLSNPPRIIAFVRLDTRAGAEEIIERLHGRMVRGWNDTGSRISVRFADTAEQRELRRQERAIKEGAPVGDSSPARLTIAQAALLNLRGQDLRSTKSPTSSLPPPPSSATSQVSPYPVIGQRGLDWPGNDPLSSSSSSVSGHEVIGSSRDYSLSGLPSQGLALGSASLSSSRNVRLGNGAPDVEYASAFASGPIGSIGSQSQRPYQSLGPSDVNPFQVDYSLAPGRSLNDQIQQAQGSAVDPAMKALLASLNAPGSLSVSVDQREVYRQQLEQQLQQEYLQQSGYGNLPHQASYTGSGVASTHTGYTPAEEYIMRTHVERQRLNSLSGSDQFLQQQRKRPSPLNLGRQSSREGDASVGMGFNGYSAPGLAGMSDENAFHAQAASAFGRGNGGSTLQHNRMSRDLSQYQHSVDTEQSHQAHMRSSTLPQHQSSLSSAPPSINTHPIPQSSNGQAHAQRHFSRNSMSVSSTTALRTPQHASAPTMQSQGDGQGTNGQASMGSTNNGNADKNRLSAFRNQSNSQRQDDNMSNSPASSSHSPSMISPALTYSSQGHTPSTLSPATPFFGSFNSQSDGFGNLDAGGVGNGKVGGGGGDAKVGVGHGVKQSGVRMVHGQQVSSER